MTEPSKKNFEDVLISTPIDKMIELIKENREIDVDYLATKLGEHVNKVEEWASVLEDQGMIKVDYSLSKIRLKWNFPTKGEAEKRAGSYKEGKEKFAASLGKIKEEMEKEGIMLESYDKQIIDILSKYQSVVDTLKKGYAVYSGIGTGKDNKYLELTDRLVSLNSKTEQVSDHLMVIEMNMKQIKDEMSRNLVGVNIDKIRNTKQNMDSMMLQMTEIQKRLEKVKTEVLGEEAESRKIGDAIRSAIDFKEKQENLENAIAKIERNATVIVDANETIKFFTDHISSIEKRISKLSADVEDGNIKDFEKKMEKLNKEKKILKEELEETRTAIGTVRTSLNEAIPDLADVKPLQELKAEMEDLKSRMSKMEEIRETLAKLKELDKIISDISELNENINLEKEKLTKEVGDLVNIADEEVETYKTFERIRDRVVTAVNNYSLEITRLKEEYGSAKKDIEKLQQEVDDIVSSISTSLEDGKNKDLLQKTDKIISSFKKINEVSSSVNAMKNDLEMLNKNIVLLDKEFKVLELRSPEEVGKKINLAENQMDEYKKKKKELSEVIKKMWEEEGKK